MAPLETRGAKRIWTPERVIEVIQRWNALYGAPPRAADLNPSSARWAAQTWRIERYKKGDPETGEPWPSLNAVKEVFDGSLNKAVRAAGLEPGKPGPTRRTNVNLDHARNDMPPDGRVALDGLRARVRDLEALVDRRERELRAARDRPAVKHVTKIVPRVRTERISVVDHSAVKRAEKALMDTRSAAALAERDLRADLTQARSEIRRIGALVSRRDAAVARARDERKELLARVRTLERRLDHAVAAPAEPEVREVVRTRVVEKVLPAPEQVELDRMRMERDQALRHAEAMDSVARKADAEYLALASAVKGEARRLSPTEIRELAQKGPAGPVLVAEALQKLARARKTNRADLLGDALLKLAAAAVSWRERL